MALTIHGWTGQLMAEWCAASHAENQNTGAVGLHRCWCLFNPAEAQNGLMTPPTVARLHFMSLKRMAVAPAALLNSISFSMLPTIGTPPL